ncbi:MAG: helix-turn-helix transcriptional regulator [Firmicutes bacterium]|nr:helix-turn-helix transcriptional regulator [Bacillota bacterium]
MATDERLDVCDCFSFDEEKVDRLKEQVKVTEGLGQIFKALGDDNRIKIAYALSREELCVCDVAETIDSSVAAASHHLRLLKNLGLAKSRKQGKMVYYSLRDECVKAIIGVALEHHRGHCEAE